MKEFKESELLKAEAKEEGFTLREGSFGVGISFEWKHLSALKKIVEHLEREKKRLLGHKT